MLCGLLGGDIFFMKLTQIFATALLASTTCLTQAAPIWQDFSITGLYGENYELTAEPEQSTATFEYAAKLQYGDFFVTRDNKYGSGMITSSPGFTSANTALQTHCLPPVPTIISLVVYSKPFSFFNLATIAFRKSG